MFDRYTMFRRIMSLVEEFGTVTDADMKNFCGETEVSGFSSGTTIEITMSIKEGGEKDAEKLFGASED